MSSSCVLLLFGAASAFVPSGVPSAQTRHGRSITASLAPAAQVTAPHASDPLFDAAARLHSAATRWGMASLQVDDVLLAMVSPEAYWLLAEWRRQSFGEQEALKQTLTSCRHQILAMGAARGDALRGASVTVRPKGLWSTFHKAAVRQQEVHDVLAVRVVLRGDDCDDCYAALDSLRQTWPSVPRRGKDYVRAPKPNGYRALHDTVLLPCGAPMEIQIRTEGMHREAEFGSAAHRRYKGALARLPRVMLHGVSSLVPDGRGGLEPMRWPLQAPIAISLAARLAHSHH